MRPFDGFIGEVVHEVQRVLGFHETREPGLRAVVLLEHGLGQLEGQCAAGLRHPIAQVDIGLHRGYSVGREQSPARDDFLGQGLIAGNPG